MSELEATKENFDAIQKKLDNSEDLTSDELMLVMSEPNTEEGEGSTDLTPEEKESLDSAEGTPENIQPPKEEKPKEDEESPKEGEGEETPKEEKPKEEAAKKEPPEEKPKKEEPAKKEKPKEDALDTNKIEKELEKPEGQEDIKDFSTREQAYFWQMRRDRRARQNAEVERDAAKFENIKLKQQLEKPKEEKKEEKDDRDDSDVATVKDIRDIKTLLKEPPAKKEDPMASAWMQRYLLNCDTIARKDIGADYDEILECSPEIIDNNPGYQKQIAEAITNNENPAVKMYHLIKGDPKVDSVLPLARARLKSKGHKPAEKPKQEKSESQKEKEAREAEEKLKQNKDKPKTSGHHSGGKGEDREPTVQDYLNMSTEDFQKLPKAKRDEILKSAG